MVFNHSVKVPTQYRKAAKVLEQATQNTSGSVTSLKDLIFGQNHVRTGNLYALFKKLVDNKPQIDVLIQRSKILEKEARLNKSLCYVLVTELMFGACQLNGESKPVTCVRGYKEQFDTILSTEFGVATVLNAKENEGISLPSSFSQKPRYVRINTNKISREEALEEFRQSGWFEMPLDDITSYNDFLQLIRGLGKFEFCADFHVENLFVFPASSKRYWAMSPLVAEAKAFLQDKASCLPATLLAPPPRSCVLDMCAAPGMKTTHLSAVMKNRGIIYAIEQHNRRFETLKQMVERANCKIVQAMMGDALKWDDEDTRRVEYILVDPSCSGSGMVSRLSLKPITKSSKQGDEEVVVQQGESDRLYKLAGLQIKMLTHALLHFPEAKRVVYSTCSLFPEENEQVVQGALGRTTGWKLVKPLSIPAFGSKDNPKWNNFGSKEYKKIGSRVMYCRPEDDLTDGFFVAVFERDGNEVVAQPIIKGNPFKTQDDEDQVQSNGKNEEVNSGNELKPTEMHTDLIPELQKLPTEAKVIRKRKKEIVNEEEEINAEVIETAETKKSKSKKRKTGNDLPILEELTNGISENCKEAEIVDLTVDHEETHKKSKKKSKAKEPSELIDETQDHELKSIKKKKRRTESDTPILVQDQPDDNVEKPKKKKKKHTTEN